MAWSESDIPDQTGRVAVVTGANSGLGEAIATMLAQRGATTVLACRNVAKAEEAADRIRVMASGSKVEVVPLDLASLASVEEAATAIRGSYDRLDLLCNNAGLMAIDESRTEDGFEMQLGVNHLGHYALTGRLLDRLIATPGSRVVSMSSMGHRPGRVVIDDLMFERRRYSRWPAYFQSKLANILFTTELQRRLAAAGAPTEALAAHPGATHTDLGSEGSSIMNTLTKMAMPLGQSPHAGALPFVRAATDPGARGGEYYGPKLRMRGVAVKETPSRRARDVEAAGALWRASEELTGVRYALG